MARRREEFDSVGASQVGDRAQDPLAPEDRVRKARDVAHVDSGADHGAAFADRLEHARNQIPDGCEDHGGVELDGRQRLRGPGPDCPQSASELLADMVCGTRECIDAASLMARDLN